MQLPGRIPSPVVYWRALVSVFAPVLLLAVPLFGAAENRDPLWCLYTILVMAVYWIFECVPLAITSLIPLVLLPIAGVASTKDVSENYLNATNMMFVAGLMMAIAVEHCGLHHRISLNIINAIGTDHKRLMLGFMLCTMFLSMWISNTATTAMMVPIVDAISAAVAGEDEGTQLEDRERGSRAGSKPARSRAQETARNYLLLACAYASNIGGTGVITGSPPNLVVLATLDKEFPDAAHPLSYASWMSFCVPLMLVNCLLAWAWILVLQACASRGEPGRTKEQDDKVRKLIRQKKEGLGKMTLHEWQVLILFIILILLWFFKSPKFISGWGGLFERAKISQATPAVLIVCLAFLLPREYNAVESSPGLLDWNTVEKRLPWGVILLLGGGFALADATKSSGLNLYLVKQLDALKSLPLLVVSFIIALATTTVTEVASNTATANILVPILAQMSVSLGSNPLYLMLTAAVCCSYAFMLPVATAPNAIVFGASSMRTADMMRAGLVMNVICVLTTWGAINTYGTLLFGLGEFPVWAGGQPSSNLTSLPPPLSIS